MTLDYFKSYDTDRKNPVLVTTRYVEYWLLPETGIIYGIVGKPLPAIISSRNSKAADALIKTKNNRGRTFEGCLFSDPFVCMSKTQMTCRQYGRWPFIHAVSSTNHTIPTSSPASKGGKAPLHIVTVEFAEFAAEQNTCCFLPLDILCLLRDYYDFPKLISIRLLRFNRAHAS